jgi:hypothetical protein
MVSHLNAKATQLHWAEFTSSMGNLAMLHRNGRLLIKCNSFAESPNLVQQTGLYPPSLLISCSVTIEAVVTGQRFAQALRYDPSKTFLYFHFWSLLQGRVFANWVAPELDFLFAAKAKDTESDSKVRVPMDASQEQLIGYVSEALKPLARAFGGYELPNAAIAHFAKRRLGIR